MVVVARAGVRGRFEAAEVTLAPLDAALGFDNGLLPRVISLLLASADVCGVTGTLRSFKRSEMSA